ncbi:MAG: YdiU family protein [Rhodobacteraceae bacterium]|nr:YdiU family protein [Paracoccaceae bacterium]
MTLHMPFDNSYARLPERFYARLDPTPVAEPRLLKLNARLAADLGLDPEALARPEGVAMLAGNLVPAEAEPLAQAYAGHQFGGWVPQLGDGRAILLGEVVAPPGSPLAGRRFDLQLKGAGRTPFSRMGDGRAWLGPVLREYLVSEAMHALGIPTTRALAAVATGEWVLREDRLPGAVLTRVAASHIRVGTFQFFAARQDREALRLLTDHALARHYPHRVGDPVPALALLEETVAAQARLVALWMGVGFIHGVMNTDNTAVSGETIDYGPCAFMDSYHPATVFSSIDSFGRYAYANQPQIAVWNMAQLASALLPLIDADEARAVERATEAVHAFAPAYEAAWLDVFGRKIGLAEAGEADAPLIQDLLSAMADNRADFTRTFRALSSLPEATGADGPAADGPARDGFLDPAAFDSWASRWRARLAREPGGWAARQAIMRAANPALIPRNHRIEEAIRAALAGDLGPFERLDRALARPWEERPEDADLRRPPAEDEAVRRTFCGT